VTFLQGTLFWEFFERRVYQPWLAMGAERFAREDADSSLRSE